MLHQAEIDHYQILGVTRQATLQEIRNAYRGLALKNHPDRNLGIDDDAMQNINAAYEILGDPIERERYDRLLDKKLGNSQPGFEVTDKYKLHEDPHSLNHYEFIHYMYGIKDDNHQDYFYPGQYTARNQKFVWNQVDHTLKLFKKIKETCRQDELFYKRKRTSKEKRILQKLILNEQKLTAIYNVFEGGEKTRVLYDLSLEPDLVEQTELMDEIKRQIGGRERLREYIRIDPEINITLSIFALRDVNLLTPDNFEKLIDGKGRSFHHMSFSIVYICEANLLTQANLELLLANRDDSLPMRGGISHLSAGEILNQQNFEDVVHVGKGAKTLGASLKTINECQFLNDPNRRMLLKLTKDKDNTEFCRRLTAMTKNGILTAENGDVLKWCGNPALQPLCRRIDEMFAHGLYLLCNDKLDTSKAEAAMQLAIELKQSLKTFFEKSHDEQVARIDDFKQEFNVLLYTRDGVMREHRAYWKVILLNIAIAFAAALTVIGLIVLGGYYIYSRQLLFSQTEREKLRDAIHKESINSLQPIEDIQPSIMPTTESININIDTSNEISPDEPTQKYNTI